MKSWKNTPVEKEVEVRVFQPWTLVGLKESSRRVFKPFENCLVL